MNKEKKLNEMSDIFGNLFYITNRLQTIIDRDLVQYGLSTKQGFLMAVIGRFFTSPPKLIDVAEMSGSSYQNVKQLALKLEKNGYVKLDRDVNDRRAVRISLTPSCVEFWNTHYNEEYEFFNQLFDEYNLKEISELLRLLNKMMKIVKKMG